MRFTARQQLALELIADGQNISSVAESCNCSRQTIYDYLADPDFTAALNKRRSENIQALTGKLLTMRDDFIATLKAGFMDRNINNRLRTASIYKAAYGEFLELADLESRISALEALTRIKK